VEIDSGSLPPDYPAPDCTLYVLPGPYELVAATPRPDHDAEVLALALDPTAVAAAPADYDTITADLGAIRALDPTLADVHVGCVVPSGIAFWFFDDEDVNQAIWADDYQAWDCHAVARPTRAQRVPCGRVSRGRLGHWRDRLRPARAQGRAGADGRARGVAPLGASADPARSRARRDPEPSLPQHPPVR